MKKIIKTKAKAKAKVLPKTVKLDYKEMYNSLKTFSDNLKEEFDYEQNLRIKCGEIIDDLYDEISDLKKEIKDFDIDLLLTMFVSIIGGGLLVMVMQMFF